MKIPPELDNLSKRDLIQIILELQQRLLAYENAHTPPSLQKGQRHYPKPEGSSGKRGDPAGHEGTTRPQPEPTETKTLQLTSCPKCNHRLRILKRVETRIVEETPELQPLREIKFLISHYHCANCNEEVVPTHPELKRANKHLPTPPEIFFLFTDFIT